MKGIITHFLLILLLASKFLSAQDEYFHEIVLEKALFEKNEWEFFAEANFKYLYDQDPWRRWGVALVSQKRINNLSLSGGLNSFYTFNKDIVNFLELRPWSALRYDLPVLKHFALRQRLKYEWRFFYTNDANSSRANYGRLRYQLGIDIPLPFKEGSAWRIRPYFEWFIIRDPETFERFPNERYYGIMILRHLKGDYELYFKYQLEEFYQNESHKGNGHIFLIGLSF